MSISNVFKEIAILQPKWSSENTSEMKIRGELIRHSAPEEFKKTFDRFRAATEPFGAELAIEGKDGIGRKTPAPWIRFFSRKLSPSATNGFYVVVHFSTDGEYCFFTLGTGTSHVSHRGDLVKDKIGDIQPRVDWICDVLSEAKVNFDSYGDTISIGSSLPLVRNFEVGTALCKAVKISDLSDELIIGTIEDLLDLLSIIYSAVERMDHLPESVAHLVQSESFVKEKYQHRSRTQGRGLNGEQRKAVELRAMAVVKKALVSSGYEVEDKSGSHSYDFLAKKNGQNLKVEVKGSTNKNCDAVLMTKNEVDLHHSENGETALGIVSGIALEGPEGSVKGVSGMLELYNPWEVSDWNFEPTTYVVKRKL